MRINYILLNRKLFYGKRYLKKLQKIIADTVSNYINNYLSLNVIHKFYIYIYYSIHIYVYNTHTLYIHKLYVGDERTPEPSLRNFGKTPSTVI